MTREDCPKCKRIMNYIFPAPHPDPAIEAELARFQECRVGCQKVQVDIKTGELFTIKRINRHQLMVNGVTYQSIADWLYTTGIVKPEPTEE